MEDLKKLFGVYIASFVDFRQEDVDEGGENNEESFFFHRFLANPFQGVISLCKKIKMSMIHPIC